jgi:RND family efflux transporter MFP subunit
MMTRPVWPLGQWMALLAGLACLAAPSLAAQAEDAAPAARASVVTTPLRVQQVAESVSGFGVVVQPPQSVRNLNLPRAGQVVSVSVSVGTRVSAGTELLQFATAEESRAAYAQATQAVAFARSEQVRVAQLFAQQLVTRSQLESANKTVGDAELSVAALAAIGADRPLEVLRAPFDATVQALPVAAGDRLAAGAALMVLARPAAARIAMGLESASAARLHPGQTVRLISVADPGRRLQGRVSEVAAQVNPQTQLVDVLVAVPGTALQSGSRYRAEVQVRRSLQSVVPRSAVLQDAEGSYVFVVRQQHARRIPVQAGWEFDDQTVIHGSLVPGEAVVRLGNYELSDGMAVDDRRR